MYWCDQQTRRRSACGLHLRRSSASWLNAQVYYTLVDCNPLTPLQVCALCRRQAKFHYTGLTGPDRTRADFFAARVSEKLRWIRAGLQQSPCGSIRVRAGPVGSGRARVVEFSLYAAADKILT